MQILNEAGANARHRPLLRDLAVPGVQDSDTRQLDIVAGGLPLYGGRMIVGDATLLSLLFGVGVAGRQSGLVLYPKTTKALKNSTMPIADHDAPASSK